MKQTHPCNDAAYVVVRDDYLERAPLVIRDLCAPGRRSVTNDAERVVAALAAQGRLKGGRRLFYYDSDGALSELLVKDGRFSGFAPLEAREREKQA